MKTIHQSVTFDCPAHAVYWALMDPREHAELTGSTVHIEPRVGGEFSAYDGDLSGSFIELIPDELIVMHWRSEMLDWPEDHYSRLTIELFQSSDGTTLEVTQTGVPDDCCDAISDGWHEYYWELLRAEFGDGVMP